MNRDTTLQDNLRQLCGKPPVNQNNDTARLLMSAADRLDVLEALVIELRNAMLVTNEITKDLRL